MVEKVVEDIMVVRMMVEVSHKSSHSLDQWECLHRVIVAHHRLEVPPEFVWVGHQQQLLLLLLKIWFGTFLHQLLS